MLLAVLALAGTAPRATPGPAEPGRAAVRVVATTTQCADLARQVCAGIADFEVDGLMHAGVDPHLWRPTVSDVRMLAGADAVVCNGLMLEGRMSDVFPKLARRGTRVVELATAVPMDRLIAEGDGHAAADPHVWMDPSIWASAAHALADALAAFRPGDAGALRANAGRFASRCLSVAESIERAVATVPPDARLMVTAHDAFRYFGRAYDVEVVGVQGTSTEAEAGLADINRLVELIVSRGIPAVFVETSVSDRNVAALREGAMARGRSVALGGSLYSDSLGGPGSGAETLETALAANVETIVAGLTGGR